MTARPARRLDAAAFPRRPMWAMRGAVMVVLALFAFACAGCASAGQGTTPGGSSEVATEAGNASLSPPEETGPTLPTPEDADPTTPPATGPTSVPVETQPATAGYSGQAIAYTDAQGWTYRYEPELSSVEIAFSKRIDESPPGQARFVATISAPESVPGSLVGDTPGRTPPQPPKVILNAFYPLGDADQWMASESSLNDGTSGRPTCAVHDWLGFAVEYLAEARLPTLEGLYCSFYRGFQTGPYAVTGETGDDDEARVDALLTALNGVEPILYVAFDSYCLAFYFPDGTVTTTTPREDCTLNPL